MRPTHQALTVTGGQVELAGQLEVAELEHGKRPLRVPRSLWSRFPPSSGGLEAMVSRPSGVRLRTRTVAAQLELHVRCTRISLPSLLAERNGFSLVVDGADVDFRLSPVTVLEWLDEAGGASRFENLESQAAIRFDLPGWGERHVEVWFPQMVAVDLIDVVADAPLELPLDERRPVWAHYGSSISHGADAENPRHTWPATTARLRELDLINLGLAGECHLDPFMADAIIMAQPDVVTLELGVNVVGSASMTRRTFAPAVHGFLDRLRATLVDNPIVIASGLYWRGSERTPGPAVRERREEGWRFRTTGSPESVSLGALSMQTSREQLHQLVSARRASGDFSLHYVDGLTLFGPEDARIHPLADDLHPDAPVLVEIGRRFAALDFWPR